MKLLFKFLQITTKKARKFRIVFPITTFWENDCHNFRAFNFYANSITLLRTNQRSRINKAFPQTSRYAKVQMNTG